VCVAYEMFDIACVFIPFYFELEYNLFIIVIWQLIIQNSLNKEVWCL
jgi:hypothetical protein